LYARLVTSLQEAGVNVHYLSNITGHGWRKLMRAEAEFSYVIQEVSPVQEIFNFIAEQAGNDETDMYGNYNMGAGYAVYVPADQAGQVVEIAGQCGFKAWNAGSVEAGPKQVVIEPKQITFGSEALEVR
jgi:phosphoribosylformylglycinamidine cyclo-ligase